MRRVSQELWRFIEKATLTQVNNDKNRLDMRLGSRVYFCSVKGFYCGRAKRIQKKMCPDCPADVEERAVKKD